MKNLKQTISNITAVIRSDIRRLSRSVVAVVCVMGLALVPCLYAWFNIISNWDPYTEESTSNLKIAVASADKGEDVAGARLNLGSVIIEKLHANKQIDWQFPENTDAVMDGLYAGDYYAGLIIPEDFSADVFSFLDGSVDYPEIIYYDNQKMNAVASKVTDRAQELIKDEINSIFVSAVVDKLSSYTSLFSGFGVDPDDSLQKLETLLESIKSDLRAYISIMDSMASVTKSAATVTGMTGNLLPDVTDMLVKCRDSIGNMQGRIDTSKEDVIYAADSIRTSAEELKNTAERLDKAVDSDPAGAGKAYVDWDFLYSETGIILFEGEILDDLYYDINKGLHESFVRFDDILKNTDIDGNLISSMSTLQDSLTNLDSLLKRIQSNVKGTSMTIQQYTNALNSCTNSINKTKDVMSYMVNTVDTIQGSVTSLRTSESFTKILDLFDENVGDLVEYLHSPANLEVVRVYAVENTGSGMAPFYTVLSLYASALLSASLLHTHVKRRNDLPDLSDAESFFGRYFIFFAIGQVTALITVLGVLYYIGIQCYNPFLFWLAAALTSFVFTMLNFGLVFAFGNIGEALAIVILVIQVAGSGGTYPVQMLPEFFQKLYSCMPFNFAMTAMRETIGGSFDHVYLKNVLLLLAIAVLLIPITLILSKIFKPVLRYFEESKAKTKLMH